MSTAEEIRNRYAEMYPAPERSHWSDFQDRVESFETCPLPQSGCISGYLVMGPDGEPVPASNGSTCGSVQCGAMTDDCLYSVSYKRRRALAIARKAGYERQFKRVLLNPFETQPLQAVRESFTQGDLICVLCGSPGIGKDLAVAHWFHQSGQPISRLRWFKAADIIRNYGSDSSWLDQATAGRGLTFVIEELGNEPENAKYKSGSAIEIFQTIIDRVTSLDGRVAATSNLSESAIAKQYDKRLYSRIKGFGRFYEFLDEENPDLRPGGG